jgi:hypothetical protein
MRSAYGLPRNAISWARRIFEAAIIDIALVILAVFRTLRMRRLICRTLGIIRFSCPDGLV